MNRVLLATFSLLLLVGCGASSPPTAPDAEARLAAVAKPDGDTSATAQNKPVTRRGFTARMGDRPMRAGISYGPYREGQRPGGPNPTPEQILEDLKIIAGQWQMIRVYSSRAPTEDILRAVRDHKLPIGVMVGAWIAPDAPKDNAEEVAAAIRLANAYPEQVIAVSVGNESQVAWSGHRSPRADLIEHIRTVRAAVTQPVTTADDYNFWNKPESHAVADEVDFLLLHAYAMWNQQQLADAIAWTERTVASIAKEHPDLTIVLGETGWATELNPEGEEVKYIKAPAGEAEQAVFFNAFTAWAKEAKQAYFYFEAFDEPWKGSDDPREVEKHWGLYNVDRTPKAALKKVTP